MDGNIRVSENTHDISEENLYELASSLVSGYGEGYVIDERIKRKSREMKELIDDGDCSVAMDGEKVVGFFGFKKKLDDFNGKPLIEFSYVTVLPQYRGSGLMMSLGAVAFQKITAKYEDFVFVVYTRNKLVKETCANLGFQTASLKDYYEKVLGERLDTRSLETIASEGWEILTSSREDFDAAVSLVSVKHLSEEDSDLAHGNSETRQSVVDVIKN